VSFCEETPD